jgi:4-amino-4-deoxy-L-arabinose transferase-like glycosyltransferase
VKSPPPEGGEGAGTVRRRDLFVLALLVLLVYLPGISSRGLWNPDEPRYAEVGREMLVDGSWMVPHLNGRVYTQKPPLHFWSIAFFGWLRGGVDEAAARLPAVCAALGATWLVYLLGTRLFSRGAGLLAGLIFATSAKVLWQGRIGQIDMTLAFFVVLAVYCWTRGLVEHRWTWGFWLATGLATLAKGPAGLFPPLLSIVVFLAMGRQWREIRELRFGRGFLLYLGVLACWLGPAVASAGWGYLHTLVFGQTLHRYFATSEHPHAFYYYLTLPPVDFFPWFFLLPLAGWTAWRCADPERRRHLRLLWTWAAVTVAFFSVSPGKRSVYILAIYAPLAVIAGAGLWSMASARLPSRRALLASVVPIALIAGLIPAALAVIGRREPEVAATFGAPAIALGLACTAPLVLAALAALVLAWQRRTLPLARTLAAGMAATLVLLVRVMLPIVDPIKSARAMAERFVELARPDEPFALYPMLEAGFLFYTERTSHELQEQPPEAVLEFARGPGRRWLLIERDDVERLPEPLPMVEVARDPDWEEGFVLYTTPPWPRER